MATRRKPATATLSTSASQALAVAWSPQLKFLSFPADEFRVIYRDNRIQILVDDDDSYTIKFKGDRLDPSEEAYHSQSKFVVSRSKYSGNLLLVLQDDARVHLR